MIAASGRRQLHVAETEKYPHVTYFFGGGEEAAGEGERRELVPSPRDVPDLRPQARDERASRRPRRSSTAWASDAPTFGIINFANADMVGHTGVIPAAVSGGRDGRRVPRRGRRGGARVGGACVITADHGNADNMLEPDGSPNTAHSLNPVPLIVTVPGVALRDGGVLADVAPTVLELLGDRRSRRR